MATVNAEVRFAPQLTAWFAANPTKVLQDGEIVYCSDGANVGKYVIGDNSTALSGLTFYGGVSSSGLTIGTTTITSGTNTRILYNNAGVVGEYLVTGTGTTAVLSTSPTITNTITVTGSNAGALSSTFTNTNSAGWSNLSVFNDTSKSISLVSFGSTTAVGTFYDANTAWVVSDTTNTGIVNENASGTIRFITGGFGAVNERVRVGTATTHLLTNQVLINTTTAPGGSLSQVRIAKGTGTIDIGEQASGRGAIWLNRATPTNLNYALTSDTSDNVFANAISQFFIQTNTLTRFTLTTNRFELSNFTATSSGSNTAFTFTSPANTNQTLSTNIPNFKVTGSTKTWATGALATQYFNYLSANTVSFVGASTATNVYGLYVEAATAGTNATITNNYAAGFSGNVNIIGTPHVSGVAGVDGTFTTVDGKTVTVSKGLITSIV